jgi:hypothetical protein
MLKKLTFAAFVFTAVVMFASLENVYAQSRTSMEWRGTVDDVVQIRIRGRNVQTTTLTGRTFYDSNYYFDGGRGRQQSSRARVEKRDGRGRVVVVQQPNRRNNWTTLVQVIDSKGGSDRYRFNVYWD